MAAVDSSGSSDPRPPSANATEGTDSSSPRNRRRQQQLDGSMWRKQLLEDVPNGRNNALVPASDVEAAVEAAERVLYQRADELLLMMEKAAESTAIDKEVEEELTTTTTTNKDIAMAVVEDEENSRGDRRESEVVESSVATAATAEILRHYSRGLVSSLYRVSQVLSDEAYHGFVHEYCEAYQFRGKVEEPNDDHHKDDDAATEDDEKEEEDEDEQPFEHADLFDCAEQAKLEGIQQRVLDRARQVESLRSSVIRQATQLVLSSTRSSIESSLVTAEATTNTMCRDDPTSSKSEEIEVLQRQAVSLHESLIRLQRQYDAANELLLRQLKDLESTAEVIAKSQARNPTRRIDDLMSRDFAAARAGGANRGGVDDDGLGPMPEADVRLETFLRG